MRSGRIPKLLVEVDYDHPILSQIPNGTFGCGAPTEENVYEDPYSAEVYTWQVEARTWNSSKLNTITLLIRNMMIFAQREDVTLKMKRWSLIVARRAGGVMMTSSKRRRKLVIRLSHFYSPCKRTEQVHKFGLHLYEHLVTILL